MTLKTLRILFFQYFLFALRAAVILSEKPPSLIKSASSLLSCLNHLVDRAIPLFEEGATEEKLDPVDHIGFLI